PRRQHRLGLSALGPPPFHWPHHTAESGQKSDDGRDCTDPFQDGRESGLLLRLLTASTVETDLRVGRDRLLARNAEFLSGGREGLGFILGHVLRPCCASAFCRRILRRRVAAKRLRKKSNRRGWDQ